jgi:hypothetical protein
MDARHGHPEHHRRGCGPTLASDPSLTLTSSTTLGDSRLSPGELQIRAVFPEGEVIIDQLNQLEDAAGVIASDPRTVRHDLLRRAG